MAPNSSPSALSLSSVPGAARHAERLVENAKIFQPADNDRPIRGFVLQKRMRPWSVWPLQDLALAVDPLR